MSDWPTCFPHRHWTMKCWPSRESNKHSCSRFHWSYNCNGIYSILLLERKKTKTLSLMTLSKMRHSFWCGSTRMSPFSRRPGSMVMQMLVWPSPWTLLQTGKMEKRKTRWEWLIGAHDSVVSLTLTAALTSCGYKAALVLPGVLASYMTSELGEWDQREESTNRDHVREKGGSDVELWVTQGLKTHVRQLFRICNHVAAQINIDKQERLPLMTLTCRN